MANTCRDAIRGALRKLGVLQSGREPSASQGADGLISLQSLYLEWLASGAFGAQFDVTTDADMVATPGMRILRTTDSPAPVITYPTLTTEGWAPDLEPYWLDYGFVRCAPWLLDMSVITVANSYDTTIEQKIYDASTGAWINFTDLSLSDTAPLASRGLDGLSCALAVRLAPEYSDRTPNPVVLRSAAAFQSSVMTRFGSVRPPAYGTYF